MTDSAITPLSRTAERSTGLAAGMFREARPKQWAKNVLVFAAPGAAGALTAPHTLVAASVMFAAFCMASAGTYYWNDIADVVADRAHATKRFRPIASGQVPLPVARAAGTVLLGGGPAAAFAVRWQAGAACVTYVALTTMYSKVLKHIAVVDLVAVAAGFVVRAVAGAAATGVAMSSWFVLVTSFGALFVVTGKRYAELREHGEGLSVARSTLNDYTLVFLLTVLSISCGATLLAYCMWAFEAKAALGAAAFPFYQLSIVPMLMALLRYLLILEQGHGAAPEEIFLADRTLQVLGVLWVAVFACGVYVG